MAVPAELFRALGALCEPPDPADTRIAAALGLPGQLDPIDHVEVFVVQLVPYAAVYLGPEGMLGGEVADRIAGFWRALRLPVPAEPDHLAALLGLYATLGDAERDEPDPARRLLRRQARRVLLWEHLLSWAVPYTRAVATIAPPCYAAWADLLAEALLADAARLHPPGPTPRRYPPDPTGLPGPAGLSGLPSAEDGPAALARTVLTPARSGLILTRIDLARAARQTGLGLRIGERAFVLRSLLEQQPAATLSWLSAEADGWAARHRHDEAALGGIARHWRDRAAHTRDALLERQQVLEVTAHAAGR